MVLPGRPTRTCLVLALLAALAGLLSPAATAQSPPGQAPSAQISSQSSAQASAPAASPPVSRPDAVARVVLSLLSYARWPAERDTLHLCVDNATRYAGKLMEGGTLSTGRLVETRRVDVMNDTLTPECDAVYLGQMTDARRKKLAADLAGRPVLVIAEEDFECEVGSMFCLNIRESQVSFRVNLDSIARSGIHVHPGVLQLGRRRSPAS